MHITERRALSLSLFLPPSLSLFPLFCSSSASLCVREETAVRYSCFASHSMKLNRMADNSVSRGSLFLPACSGHVRRASAKPTRVHPGRLRPSRQICVPRGGRTYGTSDTTTSCETQKTRYLKGYLAYYERIPQRV